MEPVKWQDNRLFGLRGGHPGWGAPGLLARAIPARFSKTVVAKMAAEKGATSCLLSALGVLFPDYPKIGQEGAQPRGVARRSQVVLRTGRLVGGAVKETTGLDASMIPSSSSARQTRLLVVRAKHPRLQFGEAPIHLEFPGLERLPLRGAFARLSVHFEQAALRVYEPVSFGDQVIP